MTEEELLVLQLGEGAPWKLLSGSTGGCMRGGFDLKGKSPFPPSLWNFQPPPVDHAVFRCHECGDKAYRSVVIKRANKTR